MRSISKELNLVFRIRTPQKKGKLMKTISKEMFQILDDRKIYKKQCTFLILIVVAAFAAFLYPPVVTADPILGSDLASFTVLGASTVTNVPTSTIVGNVGVWSASGGANAITGFLSSPGVATPDPQVTGGEVHAGTSLAQLAQAQLTTARNNLSSWGRVP